MKTNLTSISPAVSELLLGLDLDQSLIQKLVITIQTNNFVIIDVETSVYPPTGPCWVKHADMADMYRTAFHTPPDVVDRLVKELAYGDAKAKSELLAAVELVFTITPANFATCAVVFEAKLESANSPVFAGLIEAFKKKAAQRV